MTRPLLEIANLTIIHSAERVETTLADNLSFSISAGEILADGRSFISQTWWLGVCPGLAIMLVVLAINFVGDGLRDALDVRERES